MKRIDEVTWNHGRAYVHPVVEWVQAVAQPPLTQVHAAAKVICLPMQKEHLLWLVKLYRVDRNRLDFRKKTFVKAVRAGSGRAARPSNSITCRVKERASELNSSKAHADDEKYAAERSSSSTHLYHDVLARPMTQRSGSTNATSKMRYPLL